LSAAEVMAHSSKIERDIKDTALQQTDQIK
jgi:hypothetical protein